ncbi:hypothetical protein F2Q69_00058774 [Brassica cretica]|uniref:Uncharacterized protein n=1 Tax=Brassica cretica TaxID=69181 RepID=A0A8S9RPA9_BRACR|nr:hypothetical protein F2Q69_00058774 [Brassica cretica]
MEGDRGSPEAQLRGSSGSCHTAEEKLEKRCTAEIVIYRRLSSGAPLVHATSRRRSSEIDCSGGVRRSKRWQFESFHSKTIQVAAIALECE